MCAVERIFSGVCDTSLHFSLKKLYKFISLGKFPMRINLREAKSPYVHTKEGKINFLLFILSASCTKFHRRIIVRWQFSILQQEFSERGCKCHKFHFKRLRIRVSGKVRSNFSIGTASKRCSDALQAQSTNQLIEFETHSRATFDPFECLNSTMTALIGFQCLNISDEMFFNLRR